MKKALTLVAVLAAAALLAGCATTYPVGMAYTNLRLPVMVGDNTSSYTKIGVA